MGKILGYGEITVANMTEPFTVMLTNEAQQFATDSNRKVTSAQSYYTDIIVIRGSQERTDYTIGNITSGSGITVSKSSKRVTFSVSAGATIGADTGVIEIPITLDGQTVKKQFSWSCGKQGPQGVKGENGSKGKSVQNVIEYYLATSASSDVTSSTNGWSTDPTTQKLTAEKKYLWNCKQTVYDDGTKGSITSPVICGTYGDKGIDGKNATYITVSGTNFDTVAGISKMASYISINGTKYDFMPTRGHTLVIINPSNGAVENIKSYDTYTTTSLLDTPLSEVESDKIICLFTADASGLTQTSRNTLNECGSNLSDIWTQARKTHVFIGMKGLQKGQAYEIVASGSNATKTVTAYYTNSGIVTNGANGQDGISPKVSLSKSGATTTISIVDATGTHTQTVKDGTNGTPGAAGKDGKTSYFHVKYSNDGGKTFTGNSGEDTGIYMGSYTDYTEADSTDVGKYTWIKVKGDKGDTGQKGQDGTSIKITSKSVTYQTSTSGTTAPTGTWSTTVPTVNNGQYLWTKTTVQYSDGNKTEAYSVSYKGTNGTNGTSVTVSKTEVTYQVSTSGTTAPTGTWNTTMPSCDQGQYLWTKTYVKYSDGKETTSYSVSYKGVDGENGRGVSETVQYYLATSQASGVTSSTSGWSTDITTQKLTADKKYLWNCYQTKYSDGTSEPISTPKVIGVYGDKGTSTKIIRTGYKYTQNNIDTFSASGYSRTWDTADATTGLKVGDNVLLRVKNTTKGSDCLIFASITAIPSNYSLTCTSYGLIDNGADGQDGKNAKNLSITPSSQYFKSTDGGKTFAPNTITIKPTIQGEISFGKWQYSIDGGVSFADVVSGQKGLTVSNNVLTVSKDSSLYSDAVTMVTFRAVASDSGFYDTCSIAKIYDVSDIGDGRNLLTGVSSYTKDAPFEKTDSRADGWIVYQNIITSIELEAGKKYVLQAKTDGNWTANHDTNGQDPSKKLVTLWLCSDTTNDFFDMRQGYVVFTPTVTAKYKLRVNQYSNGTDAYTIHLWDIKLEKGSSPTGWTPAPEDVQTAILSTKSEISDVSLKVDNNKQAIEQRVEKTTYQQDLNLVKGDISKANEGLNKWRYEIYPKSLFASEYQGKSTMDVFAKNTNLTPSQSVLINDTDLSIAWNYDNNYIGYALTFAKFSAAKSVAITFAHDDGAHIYLNGKLIGGSDAYSQTGESLTLGFVKGWNCIEVVVNEGANTEGFKLGTTISAISECQLMNCYYGTPVARQSHITNQLVENTTNIEGVTTTMQKVMTTVGGSDRIDEFVNNYNKTIESEKQFKKTIGETYTTKDEFNGLEIGGRNLLLYSQTIRAHNDYYGVGWLTDEVETFNGCPVWSVKNQWGRLTWLFKSHVIDRGLVKVGDTLTYSLYAKTNNASGKSINCSYRFKGNANAYWFNASAFNIGTSWARYSVTFTVTKDMLATDTYMNEIGFEETASMSGDDKVYYACPKLERGTKATDYTPAPEDDEINGQNLVSNLPSNWEQGTVTVGSTTGTTYANTKSSSAGSVRPKELIPVSGNITISTAYSNQSKKPIRHWIAAYDINKNYLGNNYVSNAWNSFPRTLNMKDAKYIAIMVGYTDSSAITPSDISQICLKIERGTSATPFTLAPEDVNGKIVNVETIANQTAKKFEWIVKGGDSSSNFTLTDRVADLVAERINFNGLVTFSGLAKSTQDKINSPTSGNLITVSPTNPTSNYGNTTFSIVSDDVGGRCIQTTAQFVPFTNYASNIFKPGEQIYYNINVPNWSSTTFDANLGIWFFTAEKKCVANSCTRVTLQRTTWNRLSGYITVPTSGWSGIIYYVIGIENPNKYQLGLVSNSYIEKTTSYATTYASSAVNWVTNNGSSTTSLNSMVKKWTDGAVSDTTQINGGWIKANTITASKIAVGDFTNYADINESNTYGFSVEKTTDGVWFSKDGSKLTRDNYISKMYSCEPGQTFYVEYDISNTIKDSTEYKAAGIMLFGCDGTQTVKWYQRRGAVVGTAAGTVTHMSQQLTMPSGTRFFYVVLQIEGFQPFTGTLKIRNLSVRKAVTGAVIVDGSITADKIATDAIKSRNYISSGGTQGSFLNLSDGSFTSPNLSWDSNGNLIATNANLSGQITATIGSIGGWNIGDTSLFTGITKSNVRIYDAVNADNAQNMYQKEQHSLILANTYINSFNSSLNSSDNYWHAQGVTINDGEFQVGETLYNPNLVNSDKDEVYYDRGLTRVFGGYITMSRDCSINSDSRSLYADIILNGEELYICTNRNILFSPLRTSIFTTEDPSKYNAIETTGDAIIGGNMVLRDRSNGNHKVAIYPYDGCIEMYGNAPYIDFHYGSTTSDYTSRIIAQSGWDCLTFTGSILLGGDIYNSSNGHYTWDGKTDAYLGCGNYSGGNNIYYYANYHAFYVNNDLGSGMMYINTNGVTSRVGFTKTSDERIKKNFESFDDNIIDAYMNIEPVKYQLKQSSNDNYHFGFKAQHIDKIFSDYGDTYNESFDICTSRPIDPDKAKELYGVDGMVEEYGLRYDELIAPTTYMVQHIYKELEQVKQEKADLETRLQAIEAKLRL